MLTSEETELLTRVAALLMLLYAQPLTRILRLTLDDISCDDGEVTIRLGDPPAPAPEPFAGLLLRYAGQRLNLTNAGARWLFPGRRGGQPMTPDAIERRLKLAGIPARSGRTAALRHLVIQAPAPGHRRHARLRPPAGRPDRRRSRKPVEPLRPRRPPPAAVAEGNP
jgi:integrase